MTQPHPGGSTPDGAAHPDRTMRRHGRPQPVGPADAVIPWRRYVAVGDSFTEGLWDLPDAPVPTAAQDRSVDRTQGRTAPFAPAATAAPDRIAEPADPCRGWADLLAEHLAARAGAGADGPGEPLHYANLAVRGRLLGPILHDQVPAALALGPDLVSLVGGGNDLLRPAADPDRMAADLEDAVVRIRAAGADVLLGTGMDARDSPIMRRSRGRVAVFNAHIWSIARRHDAFVLDLWGMRSLRDWRMWAQDRIHLTTEGHLRVAQGALVALGLEPDDPSWDDPLVPLPPLPRAAQVREDVEWLRTHVYPWATRRLRGRSSGDRRRAKQPTLVPVQEPAAAAQPADRRS